MRNPPRGGSLQYEGKHCYARLLDTARVSVFCTEASPKASSERNDAPRYWTALISTARVLPRAQSPERDCIEAKLHAALLSLTGLCLTAHLGFYPESNSRRSWVETKLNTTYLDTAGQSCTPRGFIPHRMPEGTLARRNCTELGNSQTDYAREHDKRVLARVLPTNGQRRDETLRHLT